MEEDSLKRENERLLSAIRDIYGMLTKGIEDGIGLDKGTLLKMAEVCMGILNSNTEKAGMTNREAIPENLWAVAFNQLCNDFKVCSRCPVHAIELPKDAPPEKHSCFEKWKDMPHKM